MLQRLLCTQQLHVYIYLSYLEVPLEANVSEVLKVKMILVGAITHHGEEARCVGTLLEHAGDEEENKTSIQSQLNSHEETLTLS